MTYEDWEAGLPATITGDPVWQVFAYRKALFLYDVTWQDCDRLKGDPRGRAVLGQMIRSVGSITANIEEGHGRGFGRDRNHFLRIALGSARESKGWYYRCHCLLPPEVMNHRLALLDETIALLVTELRRQRTFGR